MNIYVKSRANRPILTNFGAEMPRSLPEWIGETDDTPIPPRVKLRIFDRFNKACAECRRPVVGRLLPAYDHIKPLIGGEGRNIESNIQLLCSECHAAKTATDVAEKSAIYQKRARRMKLTRRHIIPGSKDSPFKKKLSGKVERR